MLAHPLTQANFSFDSFFCFDQKNYKGSRSKTSVFYFFPSTEQEKKLRACEADQGNLKLLSFFLEAENKAGKFIQARATCIEEVRL